MTPIFPHHYRSIRVKHPCLFKYPPPWLRAILKKLIFRVLKNVFLFDASKCDLNPPAPWLRAKTIAREGGGFKLNRTVIILARYALSIRHYSLARAVAVKVTILGFWPNFV